MVIREIKRKLFNQLQEAFGFIGVGIKEREEIIQLYVQYGYKEFFRSKIDIFVQGIQCNIKESNVPYAGMGCCEEDSDCSNLGIQGGARIKGENGGEGTLGAIVKSKSTGEKYLLSVSHVLGGMNGSIKDYTRHVNGLYTNDIAYLENKSHFVKLSQIQHPINHEGAIAHILDQDSYSEEICGIGPVTHQNIKVLDEEMVLCKCGSATGLTIGAVEDTYADIILTYPNNKTIKFYNQIIVEPAKHSKKTCFSDFGDSGSLVTTTINDANYPIGVVLGGTGSDDVDSFSIVSPIAEILKDLDVEFV